LAGTVQENISGMRLIQSYNSEAMHTAKVADQVHEHHDLHTLQAKFSGIFNGVAEFMPSLGRVLVLLTGIYLIQNPQWNSTAMAATHPDWAWLFTPRPLTIGSLVAVDEPAEQHGGRQHQRDGVRSVLAGNIGGRAVNGFIQAGAAFAQRG